MKTIPDIKPEQSVDLLKELHILTRDGKLNQDSRRKLKQVYHLFHFIEPLLAEVIDSQPILTLADHGAGKSYLGFILYDLFFKQNDDGSTIHGIETRDELVAILKGREGEFADQPVVISADKNVRYEEVINVMDVLQQQQIRKVGLLTQARGK